MSDVGNSSFENRCTSCGRPTGSEVLDGLCPACLLQLSLDAQTEPKPDTNPSSPITGQKKFEPPPAELLNSLFPDCEVTELIGRGGMGAVYRGRQDQLHRDVAMKVTPASVEGDEQFARRFEREARALAALQHPNIVTIHDFGKTQTPEGEVLLFFVMEFVDGTDLHRKIQSGNLDVTEALDILFSVCEALQFAHENGVVHRDIKPGNILIDQKGGVKVADFGIAKIFDREAEADPDPGDASNILTLTAMSMGTPGYVAPETLREGSRHVDSRVDIYAAGATLYEAITGKVPLGAFDLPTALRPDLHPALDQVVSKAMHPDKESRYQNAVELATEIDRIRTGEAPLPDRIRAAKTRARIRDGIVRLIPLSIAIVLIAMDLEFSENRPPNALHWKLVGMMLPCFFLASLGPRGLVEEGGFLMRILGLKPSVQMTALFGLLWLGLGSLAGFMVHINYFESTFLDRLCFGIGWGGLTAAIGVFVFIGLYRKKSEDPKPS